MLCALDTCTALLCWISPSKEDDTSRSDPDNNIYDFLCEPLPTFASMAVGGTGTDCETGVEHKHTLVRPWCQEATFIRRCSPRRVVMLQSLIDIEERRRRRCGGSD